MNGRGPIVITVTPAAVGMLTLVIVLGLAALLVIVSYNALVRRRNLVREGFSGIDVQLKRRHELIPNLVACVTGYARFERSLLEDLARFRTAAVPGVGMAAVNAQENRLTQGLRSLFALAESYPELKANTTFSDLSRQLVATEDALQYARRYYNGAVRDLNILVESFPSNFVARWFGFRGAEYFEVDLLGERDVPRVVLQEP